MTTPSVSAANGARNSAGSGQLGAETRPTHARRQPRRFWQGVCLILLLLVVGSGLMMAFGGVRPNAFSWLVAALDAIAMFALAGYAWRRPLRHAGLQLLVFLLASIQFLRVILIAVVVWPNLVPWRGDAIAWQAVGIYSALPVLLLVAIGLYRYATDRGHAL